LGGSSTFEPGLLARANRGILYVDEPFRWSLSWRFIRFCSFRLEYRRTWISIKHPKFILVGSGNPEEGELRPQLLDRFGMHAEITTIRDPELRVKL
jgi:magnesium chelatase subunit I